MKADQTEPPEMPVEEESMELGPVGILGYVCSGWDLVVG
jgi:hypothetical protein